MGIAMSRTIDIRVTIDTDSLLPPEGDSGDIANPALIDLDRGYMIATASRELEPRGAGDLVVEADAGDTLRWFVSSGSNNFEQHVSIENLRPAGGDEVLRDCACQVVERMAIAPASPARILPVRLIPRKFHFCECAIAGDGTGSYDLVFALYERIEEARLRLISHYRWAIRLTVLGRRGS